MTTITNIGSTELAANSAYTLPFTVTPGRSLVVEVSYGNAITGITAINDNGGNDWGTEPEYSDTSPNGRSRRVYRCQTVGTPPTTITVTGTTGTLVYHVYEMTGLASSATLEIATPVAGVSGTSHSVAYTTVTDNACVILASIASAARGTVTPTNGFTNVTTSRNTHLAMYNQDVGTAGSKTITYTTSNTVVPDNLVIVYKTFNTDPTVTSVTSTATPEGSSTVHTVTLSGPTSRNTVYAYAWSGSSTAADYTQALTTGMCARTGGASGNVTVSGSNITAETGVSAFTITVPTTQDALDEDNETIVLTVGSVASTGGSITDDDALPSITITPSITVDGGDSVVLTCTLGAVSGRVTQARLVLADGTKVGGVDYTNVITDAMLSDDVTISAGVLSIPALVGSFTITIPTTP